MKGKTLRDISLILVVIFSLVGVCMLLFAWHISPSGLPYLIGEKIGTLLSIIHFALYAFALDKQRIRMAKILYRIWWIPGIILSLLIFLPIIIAGKWAESSENFVMTIVLFLAVYVPFGLFTFILWMGLKGLEKMAMIGKVETEAVRGSDSEGGE